MSEFAQDQLEAQSLLKQFDERFQIYCESWKVADARKRAIYLGPSFAGALRKYHGLPPADATERVLNDDAEYQGSMARLPRCRTEIMLLCDQLLVIGNQWGQDVDTLKRFVEKRPHDLRLRTKGLNGDISIDQALDAIRQRAYAKVPDSIGQLSAENPQDVLTAANTLKEWLRFLSGVDRNSLGLGFWSDRSSLDVNEEARRLRWHREIKRVGAICFHAMSKWRLDTDGLVTWLTKPSFLTRGWHIDELITRAELEIAGQSTDFERRSGTTAATVHQHSSVADEVVQIFSKLRAVAKPPPCAKTTDSDEKKQAAKKAIAAWMSQTDGLVADALHACDGLLTIAGKGMGTGIREWMSRCQTPDGRERNPLDDRILATVIDEATAIGQRAIASGDRATVFAEDQQQTPIADGPIPPNEFWWNGNVVKLQPVPFKFLDYVWRADRKRVKVQDALDFVYGDDDLHRDGKIKNALVRIRTALLEVDFNQSIGVKDGYIVIE